MVTFENILIVNLRIAANLVLVLVGRLSLKET